MAPMKEIHNLCRQCKNFIEDAKVAYDCYSRECPSTNKLIKIDSWGTDKSRTPTWDPCNLG